MYRCKNMWTETETGTQAQKDMYRCPNRDRDRTVTETLRERNKCTDGGSEMEVVQTYGYRHKRTQGWTQIQEHEDKQTDTSRNMKKNRHRHNQR